jgi:hypothetical protein
MEPSQALCDLFAAFEDYRRRANSTSLTAQCQGKPGFERWECCETHRALAREIESLRVRGTQIQPPRERVNVLSPAWWQDGGIEWSG